MCFHGFVVSFNLIYLSIHISKLNSSLLQLALFLLEHSEFCVVSLPFVSVLEHVTRKHTESKQ